MIGLTRTRKQAEYRREILNSSGRLGKRLNAIIAACLLLPVLSCGEAWQRQAAISTSRAFSGLLIALAVFRVVFINLAAHEADLRQQKRD